MYKRQKLEKAPDTVVFQVVRDTACSECGTEIPKDCMLLMLSLIHIPEPTRPY